MDLLRFVLTDYFRFRIIKYTGDVVVTFLLISTNPRIVIPRLQTDHAARDCPVPELRRPFHLYFLSRYTSIRPNFYI